MPLELKLLYDKFRIKFLFLEVKLAKSTKERIVKNILLWQYWAWHYINLRLTDVLEMYDGYIYGL